MTYLELVTRGKALVADHYGWILAGLALVVAVYALCHRLAVGGRGRAADASAHSAPQETST